MSKYTAQMPQPPMADSVCPNGSEFYVLKKGDNLIGISDRNNLLLEELLEANPYLNPAYYKSGQVILIPKNHTRADETSTYNVMRGETPMNILKKRDISYKTLAHCNPKPDIENLTKGQEIRVPAAKKPSNCPSGTYSYTINKGETLNSIAQKFNISIFGITRLNKTLRPVDYIPGTTICLPLCGRRFNVEI